MNPGERDSYIRAHIADLAADSFPDDAGPWRVLEITHRGGHSAVSFEEPPHAHPQASYRFKLVLSFGEALPPETVGGGSRVKGNRLPGHATPDYNSRAAQRKLTRRRPSRR